MYKHAHFTILLYMCQEKRNGKQYNNTKSMESEPTKKVKNSSAKMNFMIPAKTMDSCLHGHTVH